MSVEPRIRARKAKSAAKRARQGAAVALRTADALEEVFDSVARYFGLLAEPMRLKILHTICSEARSVSEIVAATGATQTNVSRHLALLHRAGVVSRQRDGSAVYYQVLDPELTAICRAVCVRIASRLEDGGLLRRELLDYAAREKRPTSPSAPRGEAGVRARELDSRRRRLSARRGS
jgi:DNA-binding transcriptional ArsR family regulator